MTPVAMVVLGAGLAMDATAVTIGRALATRGKYPAEALRLSLAFGLFQGAMAAGGAFFGERLPAFIMKWQDPVATVVLLAIGAKMLHEGLAAHPTEDGAIAPLSTRAVLILAVATSIDALAVGVTLPMMGAGAVAAPLVIGVVTSVFCWVGAHLAGKLGGRAVGRLDLLGGVVLCGLGLKVAIGHFR